MYLQLCVDAFKRVKIEAFLHAGEGDLAPGPTGDLGGPSRPPNGFPTCGLNEWVIGIWAVKETWK